MENPVIIFGAGIVGKVAFDIFTRNKVLVYGFLDDDKKLHNTAIADVMVLGDTDDDGFLKLIGQKTEAFVAIENTRERQKLVKMLQDRRQAMPVNAIHDTATIASLATLGHGNLIGARVIINPQAEIGNHCLIQAGAIIDSLAVIKDYVQIGAGAILNNEVEIAEGAFIGAGATIVSGIKIGKNARIGAGSVVVQNVSANTTVFGNPASEI